MNACAYTIDWENSTSSLYYYIYYPNEWIVFYIILPMLIFVGLAGNISFIFTVTQVPTLQTSTYIYLVSLSFMDLLTITVRFIRTIVPYFTRQVRWTVSTSSIYDALTSVLSIFCYSASIGFIFLVTLERYLAICHPMKHYLLKSTRRTYKLIFSVYILSIGISISTLTTWLDMNFKVITICFVWPISERFSSFPKQIAITAYLTSYKPYYQFLNIAYFLYYMILSTFTCFMLVKILISLKKRRSNATLNISSKLDQDLRQIGAMIVANGIVYLLCFSVVLLYQLFNVLHVFGYNMFGDKEYHFIIWNYIVAFIVVVNAITNPIIYATCNRNYRCFLKTTLRKWCCQERRKKR